MSYIKKFNPYELPEETLQAIATGRERVLEEILTLIERNAAGGAIQHLQVVAPRGYGKSFLMRLVQSAVKERAKGGLPAALALLPEEQHNVDAPHRLLNEIQRILEDRPAAHLLGGAFEDNDAAWEPAVEALDAAIAARLPPGRGVVVAIVENFDQLLNEVFRKPQDQSRLRALLARRGGRLMLLATATRRADADYDRRLFHATRVIELEPWHEKACLAFFEKLRGHRQSGSMSPMTRAKAKAIAQFIGGSPRMATALAQVLDSNDSLQAAEVLDALVDELTPYYKHRIESLSRRARTLLDALLRMGEPRTQSEIAAQLSTVQARIAEPFNELRASGEVVGVKAQHSAEMLYRVGDRLMAHYYRKRHLAVGQAPSLLEGITELLTSFFSLEEKQGEAKRLRELGRTEDAAVLERLVAADLARLRGEQPSPSSVSEWLGQLGDRVVQLHEAGQKAEARDLCRQAVQQADTAGDARKQTVSRLYLAWLLNEAVRHDEAAAVYREALVFAGKTGNLRVQGQVSVRLGLTLYRAERHAEAVDMFSSALALAKQTGDLEAQGESLYFLGHLHGKAKQYSKAVEMLRQALSLAKKLGNPRQQLEIGRLLGWTLLQLERSTDAVEALRETVAIAKQTEFLREQLMASELLGLSLIESRQYAEAIDTIQPALVLAERTDDAVLTTWLAINLMTSARAIGADATAVMAWQRAITESQRASSTERVPPLSLWFDEAAVAALRSGQFNTVWSSVSALPEFWDESSLVSAEIGIAEAIVDASKAQGRATAYALAVQVIDVLAQDALTRRARTVPAKPEPIAFLCGILTRLVPKVSDPSLLRDIATVLEQRLPFETAAERALLEAAALRSENPDDPAALERVDPDIAAALDRMLGGNSKAAPPSPATRRKPNSSRKRKK